MLFALAASSGQAKFHQELKQAIKGAAKEIKKGAKEAYGTVKSESKKAVDDDETPKWSKADAKRAYRGELTSKDVILIQNSLNKLGFGAGPADGIAGLQTRSAAARFQATQNTTTDGKLSHTLMEQLNEAVKIKENPSKAHE